MIGISLAQVMLKRQERQIVDLEFARRLWDVYEGQTSLMNTLRELCVVGVDLMNEKLDQAAVAIGLGRGQEILTTHAGQISDSIKFLDCFMDRAVTRELLASMKANPGVWFRDIGKIGGLFRGYAETSENLTNVVLAAHPTLKDPYLAACGAEASARERNIGVALATELGRLNLPTAQRKAIIGVLEREWDGRLSHQRRLVQRNLTHIHVRFKPDGRLLLSEAYRYSGEWFNKWQRKYVVNVTNDGLTAGPANRQLAIPRGNPENQIMERAREGVFRLEDRKAKQGIAIPGWIRPHVRLASHLDGTQEGHWMNSGIYKWRQMEWDRLWLIAQLYGLPPGATISGTTTDHMFTIYEIMEAIEAKTGPSSGNIHMIGLARRIQQYLPYIHLIPVIQMGAQMHHSICEMGTALSLNDFIGYQVGYYTSLLLPGSANPDLTRGEMKVYDSGFDGKVRKVLADAEKKAPYMYSVGARYHGGDATALAGYLVDQSKPAEIAKHKEKARLNPETASSFEGIPQDITLDYVKSKAREIDTSIV